MKTLKEWFDGLNEDCQNLIKMNTNWIDTNEPDYYKNSIKDSNLDFIKRYLKLNRYSTSDQNELFTLYFLNEYKKTHTEEDFEEIAKVIYHRNVEFESDSDYMYCSLPKDYYLLFKDNKPRMKEMFKITHFNRQKRLTLFDQLFLVDDFDNIKIDTDISIFPDSIDDKYIEIFGEDIITELCKKNENKVNISRNKPSKVFDKLFFCKDGWNESQKHNVIKANYLRNYKKSYVDSDDLSTFEDFMKRIVSVDKSYLKYMYDIIEKMPPLGNKIYELKKNETDEESSTSTSAFRYSKDIRKLAKIANICARQSISKVNASFLKEIAPLIKLYGYNFTAIFNMLYPEYSNENNS